MRKMLENYSKENEREQYVDKIMNLEQIGNIDTFFSIQKEVK